MTVSFFHFLQSSILIRRKQHRFVLIKPDPPRCVCQRPRKLSFWPLSRWKMKKKWAFHLGLHLKKTSLGYFGVHNWNISVPWIANVMYIWNMIACRAAPKTLMRTRKAESYLKARRKLQIAQGHVYQILCYHVDKILWAVCRLEMDFWHNKGRCF